MRPLCVDVFGHVLLRRGPGHVWHPSMGRRRRWRLLGGVWLAPPLPIGWPCVSEAYPRVNGIDGQLIRGNLADGIVAGVQIGATQRT